MALVNEATHEINAKVVFFGPGLAGKGTSLKYMYGKLKPEFRGKLKAMNVQGGRMLFFDFTPPGEGKVLGYRVRLHVYTISGATVDAAAWKVALKGADGLVFVADASAEQAAANSRSLDELESLLSGYGLELGSKPLVFQFNKGDRDDALAKEDLDRVLNPSGYPSFMTSGVSGTGLLQALLTLVKAVLLELREPSAAPPEPEAAASAPAPEPEGAASSQAEPVSVAAPAVPEPSQEAFAESARQEGAQASDEELSLELSRDVKLIDPGTLILPLTIRAGAKSKAVTLNLSFSLDRG